MLRQLTRVLSCLALWPTSSLSLPKVSQHFSKVPQVFEKTLKGLFNYERTIRVQSLLLDSAPCGRAHNKVSKTKLSSSFAVREPRSSEAFAGQRTSSRSNYPGNLSAQFWAPSSLLSLFLRFIVFRFSLSVYLWKVSVRIIVPDGLIYVIGFFKSILCSMNSKIWFPCVPFFFL